MQLARYWTTVLAWVGEQRGLAGLFPSSDKNEARPRFRPSGRKTR